MASKKSDSSVNENQEKKKANWPLYVIKVSISASIGLGIWNISEKYLAPQINKYFDSRINKLNDQRRTEILAKLEHSIREYYLNSTYINASKINYAKESELLSKLQLQNFSDSKPDRDKSIENLVENTVNIGHIFVPSLDIDNLVEDVLGYDGRSNIIFWNSGPSSNAFIISNEGHLVTALHVVENYFNDYNKVVVMDDKKKIHNVTAILAFSKLYDLALLKTDIKGNISVPILVNEDTLPKNATLYSIGKNVIGRPDFEFTAEKVYIKNKDTISIERIVSAGILKRVSDDIIISREGTLLGKNVLANNFSRGGYSGMFVSDEYGRIVGVHSLGGSEGSRLSPASKIKELVDFYLASLKGK